jgi:hypothetical protein
LVAASGDGLGTFFDQNFTQIDAEIGIIASV